MAAPTIDQIPDAAALNNQLSRLNAAVAALGAGSTVLNLTISAPVPSDPSQLAMPIAVPLDPPISDATTLQNLSDALAVQASAIVTQLADMGFDTSTPAP